MADVAYTIKYALCALNSLHIGIYFHQRATYKLTAAKCLKRTISTSPYFDNWIFLGGCHFRKINNTLFLGG